MPRFLTGAALLLVSTAVALFGAELTVRFVFRDVTTTSPIESYFGLRWKERHLRRNDQGFREREFTFEKPEGIYRIAVIGDSMAVAMGLSEEQRFTNLMEESLNRRGGSFEVLQFANPGAATHKHVKTLRRIVLRAEPDFVLLQWYVNDFEYSKFELRRAPGSLVRSAVLHARLYRSSALYCLLNHAWGSLQLWLGWAARYEDYMRVRFGDPEGFESRTPMAHLDTFVSLCQRAAVPVGIVLFPRPTKKLAPDYPLAFLHERVLGLCEARGIPCLDLTPTYAPFAEKIDEIWLNRFDHHLGALGHRLAADRIVEFFGAQWGGGGRLRSRQPMRPLHRLEADSPAAFSAKARRSHALRRVTQTPPPPDPRSCTGAPAGTGDSWRTRNTRCQGAQSQEGDPETGGQTAGWPVAEEGAQS